MEKLFVFCLLILTGTNWLWADGNTQEPYWDSAAVFSQLNKSAKGLLTRGLRDKHVKRAEIIELQLDQIRKGKEAILNIPLFEKGRALFIISSTRSEPSGIVHLKIKDANGGREGLLVCTRVGITGVIYGSGPTYKIIPISESRHLLMQVDEPTFPIDASIIKSSNLNQNEGR